MGGHTNDRTPGGGVVQLTGPSLHFFVAGVPRPQGSMQAIVSKSTGRAFMKQNPTLAEWRNAVVISARHAAAVAEWVPIEDGPVHLYCDFYFVRPKSHTKRQRAEGPVKYDGSDLDKLVRGIGDALTVAGVYDDDRRVASLVARKHYAAEAGGEGVVVAVTRMALQ